MRKSKQLNHPQEETKFSPQLIKELAKKIESLEDEIYKLTTRIEILERR